MKYLKHFETKTQYESFKGSSDFVLPNVSYCVTENIVIFENKKENVFIQHINGTLYTTKQWISNNFTNDLANGVAVITNEASFVVAKDEFSKVQWYPTNRFLNDVSFINHSNSVSSVDFSNYVSVARTILDGQSDTNAIVAVASEGAAVECNNYVFPNGNKGYLPSIGELLIISDYFTEINEALTLINGTVFGNYYYFSTTQEKRKNTANEYNVFVAYPKSSNYITTYSKTQASYVNTRPFAAL